jgi:hypothetical protein
VEGSAARPERSRVAGWGRGPGLAGAVSPQGGDGSQNARKRPPYRGPTTPFSSARIPENRGRGSAGNGHRIDARWVGLIRGFGVFPAVQAPYLLGGARDALPLALSSSRSVLLPPDTLRLLWRIVLRSSSLKGPLNQCRGGVAVAEAPPQGRRVARPHFTSNPSARPSHGQVG